MRRLGCEERLAVQLRELRLMRKLLRKQGFAPKLLVTDKLRSYASAFRCLRLTCPHEQGLRKNNRAENSHQPVRRREQDAAIQIGSICPALPQHACCGSQHLQPSTPSRLAINVADLPSRGGERMAECSRRSVIAHPASGLFVLVKLNLTKRIFRCGHDALNYARIGSLAVGQKP
jgi:hypothetical protein